MSRVESIGMARRSCEHPRRPRRNPDCRPVEVAEGASFIARLYNITENMMRTIRGVTRNIKRGRDAGMALRRVTAVEVNKGVGRLKAHKQ